MAVTLETYKKRKLSMLEKQFKLKLTEEDVDHMKVNMDHLVEASTKLAQLEETYSMLMYEKKQK